MKRGFTIIEMMLVIGVLSILVTIITNASINAIQSAREKQKEAMRVALQAAIANYQASDSQGRWPGALDAISDAGRTVVLTDEQAQNVFRVVVQKSAGENGAALPLIDPHGLCVAPTGAQDGRTAGMRYDDARHGDGRRRRKFGISQLLFGWQAKASGKFHRFNIVYHAETDSVTVHVCCTKCLEDRLRRTGAACDPTGQYCDCRDCHEEVK